MTRSFVFVDTEPDRWESVAGAISGLENVVYACSLDGASDVYALIESNAPQKVAYTVSNKINRLDYVNNSFVLAEARKVREPSPIQLPEGMRRARVLMTAKTCHFDQLMSALEAFPSEKLKIEEISVVHGHYDVSLGVIAPSGMINGSGIEGLTSLPDVESYNSMRERYRYVRMLQQW